MIAIFVANRVLFICVLRIPHRHMSLETIFLSLIHLESPERSTCREERTLLWAQESSKYRYSMVASTENWKENQCVFYRWWC